MYREMARKAESDWTVGVGGVTYWHQYSWWLVLFDRTLVVKALERKQLVLKLGSSIYPSSR